MITITTIVLCIGSLISTWMLNNLLKRIKQMEDVIKDIQGELQNLRWDTFRTISDINKDITMVERTLKAEIDRVDGKNKKNSDVNNKKQILKG